MKTKHLLIIACIYALALGVAYLTFVNVPVENIIAKVILADIAATIFVFIMSTIFKNSTIYDPYWSVAPMVMILVFVETITLINALFVIAIWVWGIRLTANWIYTFKSLHHQDWRYDHYKQKSGRWWPFVNFFGIHLMPTIVVITVSVPAFLAMQAAQNPNWITVLGFAIALCAVSIQLVSDAQMHRHQKKQSMTTLNEGLWRHSRHPNYFGEITFWFAIFIMMISVQQTWIAIIGPFINLLMFATISIPLMETRQKARRADYETYQENTNMLIPLSLNIIKKEQKA